MDPKVASLFITVAINVVVLVVIVALFSLIRSFRGDTKKFIVTAKYA